MFRRGVGAFGVDLRIGVEINVIAELVTEADGIGVIMIRAGVLLVSIAGIEADAFVDVGIAVPIAGDVLCIDV